MRIKTLMAVILAALAFTGMPAMAQEYTDGYFTTAIFVTDSTSSGFVGMAGGVRAEFETPGRLSVFGSITGTDTEKLSLGKTMEYDYRLALKYNLTDRFALGAGYRQSTLEFTEINGKRTDQAPFVIGSFDVNKGLRLVGEYHLPDDSKYESQSLILGAQQFLRMKGRWNFYISVSMDEAMFKVPNPTPIAPNGTKNMTSTGYRILFGTGWK